MNFIPLTLSSLIILGTPLVASTISVNFTEGKPAQQIAKFTRAGSIRTPHWNNLSGATGSNSKLIGSTGINSGGIITWKSPAHWADSTAHPDALKGVGNAQLLLGYIDDTYEMGPSFTVSNIPFKSYSLTLYLSSDAEGDSYSSPTINGKKHTITGTKKRYQPTQPLNPANTITVKNLSGNLTVSMPPRTQATRSCIAGFQITPLTTQIPPSTTPHAVIINLGGISLTIEQKKQ